MVSFEAAVYLDDQLNSRERAATRKTPPVSIALLRPGSGRKPTVLPPSLDPRLDCQLACIGLSQHVKSNETCGDRIREIARLSEETWMTLKSIAVLTAAVTCLFVCQTNGQETPTPDGAGSQQEAARAELAAQEQLKRIETEFRAELDKLQAAYRQADSVTARQEIELTYQQLQRAKVAECLKLAAAHRRKAPAAEAFSWMLRVIVDDRARQMAKDQWLKDHVNDAALAPNLVIVGMADDREFLRAVIKRATNKAVLGMACFNLAMSLRRSEDVTDEQQREAIALLERIADEFANILFVAPEGPPARLGDLAEPPLYEFKFLSVGKVAPDIEGEDIDGVKLKLSDYRGKVVLLSFWGDW